jgi:hypothetical protein
MIAMTATLALPAHASKTEERFQDLFITAGYSTALGAAMGVACLPFIDTPEDNLRYVAIGASVGFFTGTLLGAYLVLSPTFSGNSADNSALAPVPTPLDREGLHVRPTFAASGAISRIDTTWTIARF